MIVSDPDDNFNCNADSFGLRYPTIDFNNPSLGRYDIWIGSYGQGGSVRGTLYVTGNTANHP
jgi:hypothetical protein